MKLEAEGQEFAKFLRLLEQFNPAVNFQNNFPEKNTFLTCSWRFLRCNKSEQLQFKLEEIIEI